jgi:hypothetical protein
LPAVCVITEGDAHWPGPGVPFDGVTLDALRRLGEKVTGLFAAVADQSGADLVLASELLGRHGEVTNLAAFMGL